MAWLAAHWVEIGVVASLVLHAAGPTWGAIADKIWPPKA